MRALVQRVVEASVLVKGQEVGRIGPGLVVFLGFAGDDEDSDSLFLVEKTVNLYADTRKGRRPDFNRAAGAEQAREAYEKAVELFRNTGLTVATGRFQEYMQVLLQNDGPVTIMLDSADRNRPRRG